MHRITLLLSACQPAAKPATSLPPAHPLFHCLSPSPFASPSPSIFLYACIYLRPLSASIPAIRSGRGSRSEREQCTLSSDRNRTAHVRARESDATRVGDAKSAEATIVCSRLSTGLNAKCRENRRKRDEGLIAHGNDRSNESSDLPRKREIKEVGTLNTRCTRAHGDR